MFEMTKDFLRFNVHAEDSTDAIQKASDLLIRKNYITQRYVEQMLEAIQKYGPYIVLAPGIAFAHAEPSKDVLKTGISLITLENSVEFGHEVNDPVNIVIVIASVNTEDHLSILQKLVIFLGDNKNIEKINSLVNEADAIELAKQINAVN